MKSLLLAIFLLSLSISAGSQPSKGFISIDCGYGGGKNYTEHNGIVYSVDDPYIDVGENKEISGDTDVTGLFDFYKTLRSFPGGRRNCYHLKPVRKGGKYLVRAEFMYGNFDRRNTTPAFDVYLGVHLWGSISAEDRFTRLEVIAVSPRDSLEVCLVNKGLGTPYITVLEVRPLDDSMYPLANSSQALLLAGDRNNFGNDSATRYPDDPFDRIWFAYSNEQNWRMVNTTQDIKIDDKEFKIPSAVLNSAVTTRNVSESLNFNITTYGEEVTHVFMHFAEIEQLKNNQTREFNVYANDIPLPSDPYRPSYLTGSTLPHSSNPGTTTYSLRATKNSTLPPIINALEAYVPLPLSGFPTNENDEKAIAKIKEVYKMKNWQGDPCAPMEFTWEGLNCSYVDSQNPRIVSLNLSNRGLAGEISPYLANLTALVSLDLSNNNLTGGIPDELAQLAELKALDLAGNQLSGQVPLTLLEKSGNNTISISVDGNANLCNRTDFCKPKGKKNKIIIPIVVCVSVVLLFLISMIAWRVRRRRKKSGQETSRNVDHNLYSESNQFTFEEIVHMTKNFQKQIGKGGFGIVYHGQLKTGREVAVKMISKTSSQGAKEFEAEAQILTRVHHRNLVSLVGYCSDPDNLSLVYEFMAHGNLAKHLSDKNGNTLNWNARLKIALDVAQGLEYLHSFCKPPIVHRDVKTTNILLSQSFEAKLADFGLSRLFQDSDPSYLPTAVAGTPGYLDPEYYHNSTLNEKSDVYSFGIVLLELITGKPPIISGVEKMSIVSWVMSKIERGDITAIVDERIQGDCDSNSFWRVVDVAISCTSSTSIRRPSMSDVVLQLKESVAYVSSPNISIEVNSQEQSLVNGFSISRHTSLSPLAR